MPTKAGLEKELNEMLDTNFEWSQMKKDDLELLVELVDEGVLIEPQVKHVTKEHGKEKLDSVVDNWEPGTIARRIL